MIDLFPSIYVPSIEVSRTADRREPDAETTPEPPPKKKPPKPRGIWWNSKTLEEQAEITRRRTAARHATLAALSPENRPKSGWGCAKDRKESRKLNDRKYAARLQIKNLLAHGIKPSPDLIQRAKDGVTPHKKQVISKPRKAALERVKKLLRKP